MRKVGKFIVFSTLTSDNNLVKPYEVADASVCPCFPEHCTEYEAHGPCWCEPSILEAENRSLIIVHNDGN